MIVTEILEAGFERRVLVFPKFRQVGGHESAHDHCVVRVFQNVTFPHRGGQLRHLVRHQLVELACRLVA